MAVEMFLPLGKSRLLSRLYFPLDWSHFDDGHTAGLEANAIRHPYNRTAEIHNKPDCYD